MYAIVLDCYCTSLFHSYGLNFHTVTFSGGIYHNSPPKITWNLITLARYIVCLDLITEHAKQTVWVAELVIVSFAQLKWNNKSRLRTSECMRGKRCQSDCSHAATCSSRKQLMQDNRRLLIWHMCHWQLYNFCLAVPSLASRIVAI